MTFKQKKISKREKLTSKSIDIDKYGKCIEIIKSK